MTVFHALNSFMGTNGQDSWAYKFWSGFGFTLTWWAAMIGYYRKNKCHFCFRWGHHVAHVHYPLCKHHYKQQVLMVPEVVNGTI